MSAEIKYTSDGKKVIVVGSLNSQEKIVQEIFIVNGNEIPSGENFVVKSLHDAPAQSWKEKELKSLEARFDKEQREWNNAIDELRKKSRNQESELRAKIIYCSKVITNLKPEVFETLADFLCGSIKWIVWTETYDIPHLVAMEDLKEFKDVDNYKLRLVSLFGNDEGTMSYAVGEYYDRSGSHKRFTPFKNYDDAFEFFKADLLNRKISFGIIELAKKHNIQLDKEKVREYLLAEKLANEKRALECQDNTDKVNVTVTEINEMINSL